jgi:organic radical activating enzyme
MGYAIKEIFYTLQGEGRNAGRAAVFCRFAGCNLWSGREADREAAVCTFCDTDFVGVNGPGGGRFDTAEDVASAVASTWGGAESDRRLVVLTGGEPLLQVDEALITAPPAGLDWICVSPKAGSTVVVTRGHELKLVYPQPTAQPEQFEGLGFEEFLLQPMDGPAREANTAAAVAYCLAHPRWRLSLQTHKMLGIP